ncbi:carbon-nitrogen hydrolase family protein [Luteimicrobium xylanilyticum]|uniref:Deaminated glutathione amidase n=1 Tax=Luteimicrobium xylanilyticum TaxID=1133546 RepID=A0A5P9QCR9_9MICO|nr:carbon-nitrogen hydrolase family protein [Luteimicrobium xylanilyticum]QFU99177.1 Deaminated glutathione amidase [Luteimicrobium xylanilyticum]
MPTVPERPEDRPAPVALRLTLAQVASTRDGATNLALARDAVRRAADDGAHVVVLPEYASGFDPHGPDPELAEPLGGRFVEGLRAAARDAGVAVVAGTTLPGEDPARAVNVVVGVGSDGALVGAYRKVHLYDAFGQRESDRLEPGPAGAPPLVLDRTSWAPDGAPGLFAGVLTCYDLRFPESARRLVDAGADVLLVPAAWAAPSSLERAVERAAKADHWRTLLRARAIENTAFVVGVGQCGPGVLGRSLVVAPDGAVLAELGEEPGCVTVELDPRRLGEVRATNPSLVNRRYVVVPR